MITVKNLLIICTSLLVFASCSDKSKNEDQAELAEEINDEKFGKRVEKDADLLVDAAAINLAEISFGELALTKATHEDTKNMAELMILDHTKSYKEVSAMAQQKGIVVPTQVTDEDLQHREKLMEKEGVDFDKEYANMMVKGHKDAIDKFEKAEKETEDPAVMNWISGTLVALRAHLAHAEKCQEKMKEIK